MTATQLELTSAIIRSPNSLFFPMMVIRVDSKSMPSNDKNRFLRILITGFGPFGNVVNNPSARIVSRFRREAVSRAEVITRIFPVSYKEVDRKLPQLLTTYEFDVVLVLGIAGGERSIRLERLGKNRDTARAQDVNRTVRRGRAILRNGSRQLETPVAVSIIKQMLRSTGIRCRISNDAGGFLCNHAYYLALDTIARHNLKATCMFIHVPPDRFAIKGIRAIEAMPLPKQFQAIKKIAEFLVSHAYVCNK
jgi:pyroglutamyl-peptidase